MHEEIAIGGFGGQGVLFIGRLLTEAGFREGHEVVYMPSYGAEKRGGTVWCNVTISDERIGALFIARPTVAVAMNSASLSRFGQTTKTDGLLVVNQSLVPEKVARHDIDVVYIPANDLAAEAGNSDVSNLVALGALLACRPVISLRSIHQIMEESLRKKQKLLQMNQKALEKGYGWTQKEYAGRVSGLKAVVNHVRREDAG
ncbi:MAG TPA: 2-oxoacid:ferredoxin oxidoreductase subunit gamma [Dehalococcoidia bacterium]|nr:2-oxoacid:ferredoxin oxidoreductase subunit gamma [Dehalococcoidia bacterium]